MLLSAAAALTLGCSLFQASATPVQQVPPEGAKPGEARKQQRGWNDRRRTVKSYLGNLGYNSARVFGHSNWVPLTVGTTLSGTASLLDDKTVDYFERHPMKTFGDVGAFVGGAGAIAGLTIGLFSAGRIAPGETFRSASYDASQAVIINGIYTYALKTVTQRLRPDGSNHQSFPSGHASDAFALATVFSRHYGPKVGIPAYTIASLIGISRLAHKSHYLSDVVAGATLGTLVGRAVVRGNGREAVGVPAKPILPKLPGVSMQIAPVPGPRGEPGLGITLSF